MNKYKNRCEFDSLSYVSTINRLFFNISGNRNTHLSKRITIYFVLFLSYRQTDGQRNKVTMRVWKPKNKFGQINTVTELFMKYLESHHICPIKSKDLCTKVCAIQVIQYRDFFIQSTVLYKIY